MGPPTYASPAVVLLMNGKSLGSHFTAGRDAAGGGCQPHTRIHAHTQAPHTSTKRNNRRLNAQHCVDAPGKATRPSLLAYHVAWEGFA